MYKKNSKLEPGSYRLVSILSILEKAVLIQLKNYLKENDLFYQFQSGFRTSFSTVTCLTYCTDYIWYGMDNGLYTAMVMIDLQKAFDTVNHSLLSHNLQATVSVFWLTSYVINESNPESRYKRNFFQTQDGTLWCTTAGYHPVSIAFLI